MLGFFVARLLSSDSLLESSLFDFCKQAVSFCTEKIRSSIGESQELSSLLASLLGFASGLTIERYHCDQRQNAKAESSAELLRPKARGSRAIAVVMAIAGAVHQS
ncbi:hypothetical protein [Synechococcus sp. LA31]|uniref:hypothetical protein n=1 Tax=Synechococcus sp. LA31 TaxID=2741953 RepID=UPI001BDD9CA4|nr:hypothetical protein [Synechococcus sp. LA31]QVV68724.1 hypothetical protein KJJ24_06310 [Synechococcus sp. LA31]